MHIWSSSHFLLHKFLLLLFVLRVWSISLFSLCRLKSFCLKLTLVIWGLLCLKIHLKKCLRKENKEHSHGCLLKKEEIRQRQEPWPRRSWRWGGAEEDPLQHHSSLAFIAFTKGLKKTAVSGSKRRIHSTLLRFVFRKRAISINDWEDNIPGDKETMTQKTVPLFSHTRTGWTVLVLQRRCVDLRSREMRAMEEEEEENFHESMALTSERWSNE